MYIITGHLIIMLNYDAYFNSIYNLFPFHDRDRHLFLPEIQGQQRKGLFPGRAAYGALGVRAVGGRVGHERVGAYGPARVGVRGGHGPDLDRHRPCLGLRSQLDI